ncbi:Fic family protein [Candidatus Micrarchaeota archaeon]|nr:Fic family protein [Candidatus Micrarchaeota archaeon]
MGYIEKKKINGREYYYLTESKRVGIRKWKKTRKYLGTRPDKQRQHGLQIRPILTGQQIRIADAIKAGYSEQFEIGKSLWKEERERLVSFIFNTNAIEGNTLTYDETDSVLRGKKPPKAKKLDISEVINMKKCIDYLFDYGGGIDERLVLKLHEIEMGGILQDAGKYRSVNVRVGDYFPPAHQEVLGKMADFFKWHEAAKKTLHPLELAALVHLKFVWVHPFRDGNGRMSRLLMNFALLKNGYPLLNIFDAEKMLYYLVLREVDSKKKEKPFVDYLFRVYASQYKEFLKS